MRMEMRAGQTQRLAMEQHCATCKQAVGSRPDPTLTEAANLLGAENYSVCPACRKVVPDKLRTSEYYQMCRTLLGIVPKGSLSTQLPPKTEQDYGSMSPEEWLKERQEFEAKQGIPKTTAAKRPRQRKKRQWPLEW